MKKTLLAIAAVGLTLSSGITLAASPTANDLQEIKEFCSQGLPTSECYQVTSKLEALVCAVGSTYPASDCKLARYVKNTLEGQISKKTTWAKQNGFLVGVQ